MNLVELSFILMYPQKINKKKMKKAHISRRQTLDQKSKTTEQSKETSAEQTVRFVNTKSRIKFIRKKPKSFLKRSKNEGD